MPAHTRRSNCKILLRNKPLSCKKTIDLKIKLLWYFMALLASWMGSKVLWTVQGAHSFLCFTFTITVLFVGNTPQTPHSVVCIFGYSVKIKKSELSCSLGSLKNIFLIIFAFYLSGQSWCKHCVVFGHQSSHNTHVNLKWEMRKNCNKFGRKDKDGQPL